jgi:hypothetical protein
LFSSISAGISYGLISGAYSFFKVKKKEFCSQKTFVGSAGVPREFGRKVETKREKIEELKNRRSL